MKLPWSIQMNMDFGFNIPVNKNGYWRVGNMGKEERERVSFRVVL